LRKENTTPKQYFDQPKRRFAMLTKDQKEASLRAALAIAKEYAASGGGNQSVSVMVRNLYNTVNRIKEEIEQAEAQIPPPSVGSRRPSGAPFREGDD
jgi:hypothetical protein